MDSMDIDDPNERPTLPAPMPANAIRSFDTQAELFFSSTATLRGATAAEHVVTSMAEAEELTAWWIDQRRRALVGWVAAAVAVSAGVLVAGLLVAPV